MNRRNFEFHKLWANNKGRIEWARLSEAYAEHESEHYVITNNTIVKYK